MREFIRREGSVAGIMPSLSRPCDVSAREPGRGSLSVRTANRNSGGGLGGLHECVETGWGAWRGAAGQAEVRENLAEHRGILDRRAVSAIRRAPDELLPFNHLGITEGTHEIKKCSSTFNWAVIVK